MNHILTHHSMLHFAFQIVAHHCIKHLPSWQLDHIPATHGTRGVAALVLRVHAFDVSTNIRRHAFVLDEVGLPHQVRRQRQQPRGVILATRVDQYFWQNQAPVQIRLVQRVFELC
jgi:hypothetical protein